MIHEAIGFTRSRWQNEAKVRGFSKASLLLIEEAARVHDVLYRAMRPTLAVGNGDLWMMSTPNGQRGFFYEEWTHGGGEWERISVPATECSRIRREFLEEAPSQKGQVTLIQEGPSGRSEA